MVGRLGCLELVITVGNPPVTRQGPLGFRVSHGILHHAGGIRHEDVASDQHLHLGEAVSSIVIDHILYYIYTHMM